MVHGGTVCFRRLAEGARDTEVRFHRFLANPKVTVSRLIAGWSAGTASAVVGRHVLAIQDTSEMNFRTRGARDRGLGVIGKGIGRGLLLHPMIAVDAGSAECLGLVSGHIWTRADKPSGPKKNNARRPMSDKESRHWVETAQAAKGILSEATSVTMIADREADIYPLWATVPGPNVHVLGRMCRDRALVGGERAFTIAQTWPLRDTRDIQVREREERDERVAKVELRFGQVILARPETVDKAGLTEQVTLRLIVLTEIGTPDGAEPIVWRLLTTHAVETATDAWRMVDWYRKRWIIEQFFRILKKQGLQVEESQVETADRLLKLVAIAAQAALLTLQLTQARDGQNSSSAALAFSDAEIATLQQLERTKYAPRTPLQKNPHTKKSMAWAAWIIARLGGWDGYPSDRPPGPVTFKTGIDKLMAIAQGWQLRDVCIP